MTVLTLVWADFRASEGDVVNAFGASDAPAGALRSATVLKRTHDEAAAGRRPARVPRVAVALTLGLLAAITPIVVSTGAPPAEAAPLTEQRFVGTPGPLGPITVIGDSVLVGAAVEPSLPTLLSQRGWGPVQFRAGLGYSAGNFLNSGHEASAANWIRWWREAGWDAPNVVVNLGSNDVGFCETSVACNANTIRYMMDAIGPGPTVWWSKITRHPALTAGRNAYNQALELVASERSNLRLWDWPTAAQANGIAIGPDGVHLRDAVNYRRRSVLMADDITAQLATATRVGGDAPVPIAAGPPTEYAPLPPKRILDTRQVAGARLPAGGVRTVDVSALVPVGATAVATNLTSADPAAEGYLTAYPCGTSPPVVSSANYSQGGARGAFAVVPLSSARTFCVYSSAASDLIVDLQGAFVVDGARLTARSPERLIDTRASGRSQELRFAAPVGARAVALNLTALGAGGSGYLSAYPCGSSVPEVSNVNFGAGETIAGAAYVPVGADGTVCVSANVTVDVIVDLTGTFDDAGALAFTPAVPTRVYDTRNAIGGWSPIHGLNQTTDVRVAPDTAVAVTGTITLVSPVTPGYLTAYGCATMPPTSNLNAGAREVLANALTVGLGPAGRMCIFSSSTAHVLFDTSGWWAP